MKVPRPENAAVNVVFAGSFNPLIFQPAWFAAQGFIREQESESADVQIVHAEVVSFKTESVAVEVVRDRLTIGSTTKTEAPSAVRDLAVSTFSVLSHTPIQALGIVHVGHFPVESREIFDTLGWALAPQEPWGTTLERPGLRSLTAEGMRPDEYRGAIRVTVEPSIFIQPHGVYIASHDYFDLTEPSGPVVSATQAIEALQATWDDARSRADAIRERVFSLV